MDDLFSSSKTTEVFVTSEVVDKNGIDLAPLGGNPRRTSEAVSVSAPRVPNAAYSVTISSNSRPNPNRESYGDVGLPIQSNTNAPPVAPAPRTTTANPHRRRAAWEANNATWSYTKCAILFFTAMLVTWIPSSANRVFSVVHTNEVSMPLEYMSAFVLPLQGFWNALIYIVTSWKACKMLFRDTLTMSPRPKVQELVGGFRADKSFQMMSSGRNGSKASGDNSSESESMTELATSRVSTHEKGRMDV
jgi:hypothetical protein